MHDILFYSYLKFKKDNKRSLCEQIKMLPKNSLIYFCGTMISMGIGITLFLYKNNVGGIVFTIFEVVFSVLLSVSADSYQISKSDGTLKDYRSYCREVFEWLKSCCIDDCGKIEEIQKRVKEEIDDAEAKRSLSNQRMDKWIQTLVIPVLLAIIGVAIGGQTDIITILSNSMVVLFVFILLYGIVVGLRSFVMLLQYSEIEKKKDFARILQGTIDIIRTFPENEEWKMLSKEDVNE